MIERPAATQTTGCFHHAPERHQPREDLPVRRVERIDIGESAQAQADCKSSYRQYDSSKKRWFSQSEKRRTQMRHFSNFTARNGWGSPRPNARIRTRKGGA